MRKFLVEMTDIVSGNVRKIKVSARSFYEATCKAEVKVKTMGLEHYETKSVETC